MTNKELQLNVEKSAKTDSRATMEYISCAIHRQITHRPENTKEKPTNKNSNFRKDCGN